jgi:hypothetical protein
MVFRLHYLFLIVTTDLAAAFSSRGGLLPNSNPSSSKLSSEPEVISRNFIEITNLNVVGRKESLPASFIERWPNWFLESDGCLSRIPDEETSNGNGFVTPTSIDRLFQPIDLKQPEMKVALGIHVRSGQIRHVLPSLDISYGNGSHRNRGLCSVPLAYNWVDFGFLLSMGDYNRYQLKVLSRKQADDDEGDEGQSWDQLCSLPGDIISNAIERAIVCLAEVDSDDLGSGSHIIHVALDEAELFDMPKSKNDLRVTIVETADRGEEDTEVGILEVAIVTTMSGSDSEYLPKAYEPLYGDETLKNPLYAKFKRRQENND